jgi:hypothetical protein
MFDSPFAYCPQCAEMVLLDQTLRECAAEHGCGKDAGCPLARYFTGHDFSFEKAESAENSLKRAA